MSYISIKVETSLTPIAVVHGLEPALELHMSVFSSPDKVIPPEVLKVIGDIPTSVQATDWMTLGKDGDLVVLVVDAPWLVAAHEKIKSLGFKNLFPDFIPHVTLGKKINGCMLSTLDDELPITIELNPVFILEKYDDDYKST